MNMEEREKQLAGLRRLFALSRDAVLIFRNSTLLWANEAAERLLGRPPAAGEGIALFPELTPPPAEDNFAAAVTINGAAHTVTGVREGELLILTVPRTWERPGVVEGAALSRLRMEAFSLRMRLDAALPAGDDAGTLALYRSYYRLLHLVEELSDADALAREALPFRPEPVDLGRLAAELMDSAAFFSRRKDVAFRCDVSDGELVVNGDRERLEQLLLILLCNALLHLPDGGTVTLGVRKDGKNLIVSVDDSGTGMDGEAMSHAFSLREEPSLTAAASGAGMGLYIARGIVRLHGGAMVLTSREGEGTRVRCTLPASARSCLRDAAPRRAPGPRLILTELSGVLPPEAYERKYRQ